MVMRTMNALAWAMLAAMIAPAANAQADAKQTPENAQKFLAIVFPNATIIDKRIGFAGIRYLFNTTYWTTLEGASWDGPRGADLENLRRRVQTYLIQRISSPNVCTTTLQTYGDAVTYTSEPLRRVENGRVTRESFTADNPSRYAGARTVEIDWTKVAAARSDGNSLVLTTSQRLEYGSTVPEIEFALAEEGLAARAAYAAEVIRLKCDPAASTGF